MKLLIVTGVSGSGKSSVMDVMEDIGYYCIDNIPPKLIRQFVELCKKTDTGIDQIAVAVDIRTGDMFTEIFRCWQELKNDDSVEVKVLFIDNFERINNVITPSKYVYSVIYHIICYLLNGYASYTTFRNSQ